MKKRPLPFLNYLQFHDERLFFLLLTLIQGAIYVFSLISSPDLRQPARFIPFTLLMNVHIALYWLSPWVQKNPRWLVGYFLLQGGVAFSACMLGNNLALVFGLYTGLVGLSFGMLSGSRWVMPALAYYLVLSLVNFGILANWTNSYWWLIGMLPSTTFTVIYVKLYNRQSEARARAQALLEELETANRQLSEYAARVEDLTIANERQRMARELHDTLSQGLAGLILQLEAVDAHLANNRPERARDIVRQTMERARFTLTEARQVIDDLRHDIPLNPEEAVRREIDRFTQSTGIACNLEIALAGAIPAEIVETVVRAVSESLTNIARHAQASVVSICIRAQDSELVTEILDDGIGFDPTAIQAGHYGLLGMRERVRLAGGRFEVSSRPGQGTRLAIQLPISG